MSWYFLSLLLLIGCSNPYQELHDSLDETLEIIKEFYPEKPSLEKLRQEMLQGLIQGADIHGNYLSKEDTKSLKENVDGGELKLGMILANHQDGLLVKKVYKESAAYIANFKENDILIEFNGTVLKEIILYDFLKLIKGANPCKVTLLRRNKPLIKEITPGPFIIPSAELNWFGNIACLKFGCINKNAANEVHNYLKTITTHQQLSGLILDLRDCPGGSFEAAIGIASQFLDGHVVVEMQKKKAFSKFCSTGPDILKNLPIVVLQNKNSSSAAEVIASALKAHKRAILIGENSSGSATAKRVFQYQNREDGLILTIAFLNDPLGKRIGNEGVKPDIKIEKSEISKSKNLDIYIQKALNFLLKTPQSEKLIEGPKL